MNEITENFEDLVGKTIRTVTNQEYTLKKMVGQGGQGVVFEDESGKRMIKLYYRSGCNLIDETTLERLEYISKVKKPKNFVKIFDIIEKPYIGYVMEKVEEYTPLNSYLHPPKEVNTTEEFVAWYNRGLGLRERLFLGYIIAKAFGELEKSNLAYCDISGNNVLVKIEPSTASVKMIDIDNIYLSGKKSRASVLGTPRYIAPEVIRQEHNPDSFSDNYSLAVLLFQLLRIGHPYISDDILDGTPEDEENALAGHCDYVNDENSTNMLPASFVLTEKLKELFKKAFVDGKNNRMARPSAREFEFALLDASNKTIQCPSCHAYHYPQPKNNWLCPWCDSLSKPQARLNFYDLWIESQEEKKRTLVNSYILRDNEKNHIKNFYIFSSDSMKTSENFVTIPKNEEGYWVYNEFSKTGIQVRNVETQQFIKVDDKDDPYLLNNGDEIWFDINKNDYVIYNGKKYSIFRIARFVLESKPEE